MKAYSIVVLRSRDKSSYNACDDMASAFKKMGILTKGPIKKKKNDVRICIIEVSSHRQFGKKLIESLKKYEDKLGNTLFIDVIA